MLTTADYMALEPQPADVRSAYGDQEDQFGDLYLPVGPGPHPVAIMLHGGCWRQDYGLAPLGSLCAALRAVGLAVWSVEYRRVGGLGGWPMTFLDVAAGADALRGLAASHPLDLGRVIGVGHSAGGHLALWLAARARLPAGAPGADRPLPLSGVLGLAALADLAVAHVQGLCGSAPAELLGGAPSALPARYAMASPAALLPIGVPQRHLVGAADTIVPPAYLEAYVAAARAAGDNATLSILPEAGHFEPVDPASPAWPTVHAAAAALVGL